MHMNGGPARMFNPFHRDTTRVVSDILENYLWKYFTESCSEGPNIINNFFLNLFIQSWTGFIQWMNKFKKN